MKIYHEYFRNTKVSTRAGVASFDKHGYAEVEQDIADVLKGLKGFRISESKRPQRISLRRPKMTFPSCPSTY